MENGHVIGKIEIILKEEVLLSLNIMLKQDIEKKHITDFCSNYCNYLLSNM